MSPAPTSTIDETPTISLEERVNQLERARDLTWMELQTLQKKNTFNWLRFIIIFIVGFIVASVLAILAIKTERNVDNIRSYLSRVPVNTDLAIVTNIMYPQGSSQGPLVNYSVKYQSVGSDYVTVTAGGQKRVFRLENILYVEHR